MMRIETLTANDLEAVRAASLTLLEEVGVRVGLQEAVDRLAGAGASVEVEYGEARVRFPSDLVERSVSGAPGSIRYAGRDPRDDYLAETGHLGFAGFGECLHVIDVQSGRRRKATKADCAEVARVTDALDELCVMERALFPGDQPPSTAPLHNLEVTLRNTSKHVFLGAGDRRNLEVMMEMGAVAVGGRSSFEKRPCFTAIVCPTSPLGLGSECCDVIIGAAEAGVGLVVLPMGLSGATAPVTPAGALAQHDAEVLAGLVLAQVTRPGASVTYGSCSTIMDLRWAGAAVGAPEQAVLSSVIAALARRHGLPSWVGGGISDAKTLEAQAGYEFALNAVVPALAGATVVYGAGALESGLTFDYAKLLLDCESIRGIHRVADGVEIGPETLALDVIGDVGPYGSFLTHDHTFRGMHRQSRPRWFDRRSHEDWRSDGAKSAVEQARSAAIAILEGHQPRPLPNGAVHEMAGLLRDYEASRILPQARVGR